MRVSVNIFFLLLFYLHTAGLFAQNNLLPTDVSGLVFWLKSDSGVVKSGDTVQVWKDVSGNGNDVIPPSAPGSPRWVDSISLLNYHPVIRFDGLDDALRNTIAPYDTNFTIFIVVKQNPTSGYQHLVQPNAGGSYQLAYLNNKFNWLGYFGTPSYATNQYHFLSLKKSGISGNLYVNGSLSGSGSGLPMQKGTGWTIGRYNGSNVEYFNGDIAEIILYKLPLNDSLRSIVEQYITNKYAPGVNLGADKSVLCPVMLDAGARFKSFAWSTGATTQAITVATAGTYSVAVTNIFGDVSSDAIHVSFPGNFSPFPDTTICAGNTIKWDTQLDKTRYDFLWQDGSSDSVITITQSGQYSVTVTDVVGGCSRKSNKIAVTVDNFPQTASLGPDISICSGASIELVSGAGQAISYVWSTGATTASIPITTPGISTYTLTVKDIKQCAATSTITVTVNGIAPVPKFSNDTVCLGNQTKFVDSSTWIGSDSIKTWLWDFGDNSTSAVQNPNHLYSSAGTFAVILKVTSKSGCSNSITKNVIVHPKPSVNFTYTNPQIVGHAVQFNDNSMVASPSVISNWLWHFENTSTSGLQNPLPYTYNSPGIKSVKLIVGTNFGCVDSIIKNILVHSSYFPNDLAGLTMWLKSDSGVVKSGDTVQVWKDASGNGNDVIPPSAPGSPRWVDSIGLLNCHPVIRFDGLDDALRNTVAPYDTNFTLFIVVKQNTTSGFQHLVQPNAGGNYQLGYSANKFTWLTYFSTPSYATNQYHFFSLKKSGISGNLYVNGNLSGSGSGLPMQQGTGWTIGRYNGSNVEYFNGDIAEIILYKLPLNDSLRSIVEQYITSKYAPAVNLGADKSVLCPVMLDAGARFKSFAWSTGATTQAITVATAGTYSVAVTNIFGDVSSDAIHVSFPGNFSPFPDTTICAGNTIKWDTQLDKTRYDFLWQDGSSDSVITITQSGQYSVTVTDVVGGCSRKSNKIAVTVDNFPQTASLGPDISICSGASIELVSGAGQAISYVWSTGATTASIPITTPGISTYTLTVKDIKQCAATSTITVTVNGIAPVPKFSNDTVCLGNQTKFVDSSTWIGSDSIKTWLWDFGDNSTSAVQNPNHLYSSAGTFAVILKVTSKSGCSNSITKNVIVHPKPSVNFTYTNPQIVGHAVQFNDNSMVASPSVISNWLWHFENTSTSGLQNPLPYTYNSPGIKSVKLIVGTNFGCVDSIIKNILVHSSYFPNDLAGLTMWLKSDSGVVKSGDTVQVWKDASGNGNDVIPPSAPGSPRWVDSIGLLNCHPVIRFDGLDDALRNTVAPYDTNFTLFIVVKQNTTSGFQHLVQPNAGGNYQLGYSANKFTWLTYFSTPSYATNQYHFFSLKKSGISGNLYVNGNLSGSGSGLPMQQGTGWTIGRYNGSNVEYFNGDIAEIILYKLPLNDSLRSIVEQYITSKYAPAVNLGADKSVLCPVMLDAGARFKSFAWSTGATTQAITVATAGTYSVAVTNIFGDVSSDAIHVSFPGNFSPFPDTTICAGNTIKWDTQLDKTRYDFLWQDGSSDSVITITQSGQYSVTVTDVLGGCSRKSNKIAVTVDNFPQTASLGPDISICSGASIELVSGAGQATHYLWSTGATEASIVINTMGISTYTLSVQNARGCIAKDTITVNVKGINPVSNFLANNVCLGDKTFFSDLSTVLAPDNIISWKWDFGDGGTAVAQNPSHTYTLAGTYNTKLTVISDSGCIAIAKKPDTVYAKPNANFTVSSSPACTGLITQFVDASTVSNGSMVAWNWNFGDGSNISILKNPVHTYTVAGVYSVQLIVTSSLGCKDTMLAAVTVKQSPSVLFSSDTVCNRNATTFFDNSTGIITNWLWNFGDGSSSTLQKASHTYSLAGTYSVTLFVTASNGCVNTGLGMATVNFLPVPAFNGGNVCAKSPLQFTDASTVAGSSVNTWHWQFGTMGNSILQNPVVTYSLAGTYSVTLAVTSAQGCSAAVMQTVSVNPLPVASFSFTPGYSYPQQVVHFSDQSLGGTNYHWFFGDGQEDLIRNPVHAYQHTGVYEIHLITQNSFGCIDSSSHKISIDEPVLDIQLSDISAVKSSNIIHVSALLKNTGTLDVTTIELSSYLDDGTPIHESWTGLVRPNLFITYPFSSSFELMDNVHNIVCVEVKKVNGQNDNETSNNKKCVAITDEFTLLNPFPNPTIDEIYFLFVAPDVANVKAQVFDALGRVVASPFEGDALKGLNQIIFNTMKLENGIYVLKLSYKDKIAIKIFVKE